VGTVDVSRKLSKVIAAPFGAEASSRMPRELEFAVMAALKILVISKLIVSLVVSPIVLKLPTEPIDGAWKSEKSSKLFP